MFYNTLFYKEEALFNYLEYREKVYDNIIQLLLISKNLNNLQKRLNEKTMQFKLRCCEKLIDCIYVPNN